MNQTSYVSTHKAQLIKEDFFFLHLLWKLVHCQFVSISRRFRWVRGLIKAEIHKASVCKTTGKSRLRGRSVTKKTLEKQSERKWADCGKSCVSTKHDWCMSLDRRLLSVLLFFKHEFPFLSCLEIIFLFTVPLLSWSLVQVLGPSALQSIGGPSRINKTRHGDSRTTE